MTAVLLTLAALAVRYAVMLHHGTAWFDESFSLHFASMPLGDMLRLLAHDVHPPLHALLLHAVYGIFGADVVISRAFSVLCGVASVPFMMRLAGRFGRKEALVAGVVSAVSPILLFNAADGRMYTLLILLLVIATDGFLGILEGKRTHLLWGLGIGLALFTHVTALLPFAIMLVFGWFYAPERGRFLKSAVLATFPALLWIAFFTLQRIGLAGTEWQIAMPSRGGTALGRLLDLFAFMVEPWMRGVLLPILILLWSGALIKIRREGGVWSLKNVSDIRTRFLAVSSFLPFALLLPVHVGTTKYLFIALPSLITLTAIGAARLLEAKHLRVALLFYLLFVATPVAVLVTDRRIRWDDAMAYIQEEETSGDVIYAGWFTAEISIDTYYRGSLPVASGYAHEDDLSYDERLVRHAGQIYVTDEMVERMEAFIKDAPHVFLVVGETKIPDHPIPRWYFAHGWRLEGWYKSTPYSPIVLKLENPSYEKTGADAPVR